MVTVVVSDKESIDKALKRFKKKLEKSGVLKEYRSRQYYLKSSVLRRTEIGKAAYRQRHISKSN